MLALMPSNFTYLEFGPGFWAAAAENPFTATGLSLGYFEAYLDGVVFGGFPLQ